MTEAELMDEFLDDLTTKYDNDPTWTLNKIIKKWEVRRANLELTNYFD